MIEELCIIFSSILTKEDLYMYVVLGLTVSIICQISKFFFYFTPETLSPHGTAVGCSEQTLYQSMHCHFLGHMA